MTLPIWDLFCRVVDNYGDIGVCWRLARALTHEHGIAVRLWVDDLACFAPLCPTLRPERSCQELEGVQVHRWADTPPPDWQPGAVAVEAFACTLPDAWQRALRGATPAPLWINLEYLSAEDWVAGCHGLASPQGGGITKYFFFPGFTPDTGGLLREADLMARRDAWREADARAWLAGRLKVPPLPGALRVSLFAYEQPPLQPLVETWRRSTSPVQVLVPPGKVVPALSQALGIPALRVGERHTSGTLTVQGIPFLPQSEYDLLLWSCDLNFVRGEDSFVRAQWAQRPFVWQIYPQEAGAHHIKLDAFLARYLAQWPAGEAAVLAACWRAWNGAGNLDAAALLPLLPSWNVHALRWGAQLVHSGELAANLVSFARSRLQ
ncbi:elongation factor P maturation arginine rhamnosyltransferase EarP [Chitiniphilus purpureus]|uniref:Protein-arginine rhamnosyltransferase n=1 Tax=Chitiniphilus purpureus TaxID=2981137 RepID=A0ABY6DMB3_9NEIS|nr:elongation factor P maturation arginine rhamnosyltransferase EarP [Chitiniphilus sp. CD1]UXY14621.1 elongation factor P maturation arginine rhamnosyltransferase EarP [Chitiniphilus sp. CD1]